MRGTAASAGAAPGAFLVAGEGRRVSVLLQPASARSITSCTTVRRTFIAANSIMRFELACAYRPTGRFGPGLDPTRVCPFFWAWTVVLYRYGSQRRPMKR